MFVALDVAHAPRRIYKVWGEGKVPDFVLELSSESTMHRPKGFKCDRYRSLGVQEYWQLDTVGDLLDSHPRGYRLERGGFEEIAASGSREGHSEFRSDVLGLRLRAAPHAGGATLAFRDPLTGEDILAGRALDRKLHEIELSKRAERRRRIRAEKERIHNEKERDSERRGRRRAEERARIAEEQVQAAEGRARIAEGRVQAAAERVRKLEAMLRNRGVSQLELEF